MIGGRHSEEIRALREAAAADAARLDTVFPQIEALHAQIATLSSQMAALSSQCAAHLERSASEAARVLDLEGRLAETKQVVAVQAGVLRTQAAEIAVLRGQGERQDEAIRQVQGALERVDRQAAIDLDEMRRANVAMARAVLLRPAEPAGDQGG